MGYKISEMNELKNGDVFAFEIKKPQYKALKNKAILLIYTKIPNWNIQKNEYVFRAKITSKNILQLTEEEIEKMEYIQTYYIMPEERFLPFSGIQDNIKRIKEEMKRPIFPDKYGLLNIFTFILYTNKSFFQNIQFLGNFKLSEPTAEFIPFHENSSVPSIYYKFLEERLQQYYYDYNLKNSDMYNSKYTKICKHNRKERFNIAMELEEIEEFKGKS